jgi:leucyl aminopeptidase
MFKTISAGLAPSPVRIFALPAKTELPAAWSRIPAVAEALRTPGFRADAGEVVAAGPRAALLGFGDFAALSIASARRIGARLSAALERMGHGMVAFEPLPESLGVADLHRFARSLAEGIAIANWRLDIFDGRATTREPRRGTLRVGSPDRVLAAALAEGLELGGAINECRRLQDTPPNIANPPWIAAEARRLAKTFGLRCQVITFAQAKRLGMGGLVNVGQASQHKPCLVVLEHRPRTARGPKVALVGKTITYDTGGYSLKISNGMKGMKFDKSGGCAVLGAMRAIAAAKLPVAVTAVLPAAENMVAGDAYRPDDVITLYNGVTCEVTNTDAEGRLVLADALAWVCRHEKPQVVVDLATLTGGVVVALGNICAGLFCEHPDLAERLASAGERSGDRVWRLPLWPEHRELMKSRVADIVNSGSKRGAHPIQGAAFLSWFVDPAVEWAHVDIAGMAAEEGHELFGSGPTGFGTGLLFELVRGYAAEAPVSSSGRGRGPRQGRPRQG